MSEQPEQKIRLFVAVEVPQGVKNALASLRPDFPDLKWVQSGAMHLTMAYLPLPEGQFTPRLTLSHLKKTASPELKQRVLETH